MSDYGYDNNFFQNPSGEFSSKVPAVLNRDERSSAEIPYRGQSPQVSKTKQKPIKKTEKGSQKAKKENNLNGSTKSKKGKPKRVRDEEHEISQGRPNNQKTEKEHLKENRSYNDIVYHYSRFLIFLKIKKGNDRNPHALHLSNQQSQWMSEAKEIMSINNFPTYEEEKPIFLLNPNSVHFLIQYRITHERKKYYTSKEMKFIFLALLEKKGLLTTNIYDYVCEYWPDIVYLANNPKGQEMPNQHPHDERDISAEPEEMPSRSQAEEVEQNENVNTNIGKKKRQMGPSQIDKMREQQDNDQTSAAYEIACYLHACYEKFGVCIKD